MPGPIPGRLQDKQKENIMEKKHFYTANGWQGSRYNSKLSAKEIAQLLRDEFKKELPGVKVSVRSGWSAKNTKIEIAIMSAPEQVLTDCEQNQKGYLQMADSWMEGYMKPGCEEKTERLTDYGKEVVGKIDKAARSYNYGDIDGMIDYFDCNFFQHIDVGTHDKPFTVSAKPERVGGESAKTASGSLELVDYSDKALAVFGDTKTIKETLKSLGGRFNPALRRDGVKSAGWIFAKARREQLSEILGL